MSLTFVGMGLFNEKDISIKGYEFAKQADYVYMEQYTSRLFGTNKDELEEHIGQNIGYLSREEVEKQKKPLEFASEHEVVFLVPGDPMISTTHVDLRIEAREKGIDTEIIHGASIFTAAPGLSGLQNYKFGRSATVTFKRGKKLPHSPYDAVSENRSNDLHTLLFLDIDSRKERYMDPQTALKLLREVEEERKEKVVLEDTEVVVVSRAGSNESQVVFGEIKELLDTDFGNPLHTIIFPGELHFREREALEVFGKK